MSSADSERAWSRKLAITEAERKARERRERLELLATRRGSDEWAKVMARPVMEAAIRGGTDPAVAAGRAAEVEAGLIEGQKRGRASSPDV
jgi:hypothetical protein